jgi:hypothetical protein
MVVVAGEARTDMEVPLVGSGQVCPLVLDATDLKPAANPLRARIIAALGAPGPARYP